MENTIKSIPSTLLNLWKSIQKYFPFIGLALSALALVSVFLPFATLVGLDDSVGAKTFSAISFMNGINFTKSGIILKPNLFVLAFFVFAGILLLANAATILFKAQDNQKLKANADYTPKKSLLRTITKLALIIAPMLGLISIFFFENNIAHQLSKLVPEIYKLDTPIILNSAGLAIGYLLFFISFVLLVLVSLVELEYRPRGVGEILYWVLLILGVGWIIGGVIAFMNK